VSKLETAFRPLLSACAALRSSMLISCLRALLPREATGKIASYVLCIEHVRSKSSPPQAIAHVRVNYHPSRTHIVRFYFRCNKAPRAAPSSALNAEILSRGRHLSGLLGVVSLQT
jgi:hypothetical protein